MVFKKTLVTTGKKQVCEHPQIKVHTIKKHTINNTTTTQERASEQKRGTERGGEERERVREDYRRHKNEGGGGAVGKNHNHRFSAN